MTDIKALKSLAVKLLNDDQGICEEGYNALRALLPARFANDLALQIECYESRYYLPEDHTLTEWVQS